MTHRHQMPIAVVGMGALLPGSTDLAGAWRDIVTGKDLLTDVPPGHWLIEDYYDADPSAPDKTYAKRGGFLPDVQFDPMEFGVPPSIVPATDTAQLLALMVAQRTLEDATGGDIASLDKERVATLMGVTSAQELLGEMNSRLQRPVWVKALREAGLGENEVQSICDRISANYVPWQESSFPGLLGNVVAGRIANRFDLRGTNAVTDAACASSLAALSMGINELQLGQADLVLGGGVDTMNDIFMFMCFSKTPALSASGDCRPFSDAADGTMLGEGLVMFALMRLEDAEKQGKRIYAVLKGVGTSSDGRAKSVYAPVPEGQARALRRTYEVAGYGPETVELVEAHGTGTKAGDAAEFEGLATVFGESKKGPAWCALGSIKSQIGHTKSAAGAAGLMKAVLALHHKVLPPTIKIDRPNPKMGLETSAFYLNTQARPWIRDASHPRRASVSSFGFGGSNFHVAIEEYVGPGKRPARSSTRPTELFVFSAATPAAVVAAAKGFAAVEGDLAARARESRAAFKVTEPSRLSVVASSLGDLRAQIDASAEAVEKGAAVSTPAGLHFAHEAAAGTVGFLFPGQGSQYVGMGADVAMEYDAARGAWDRAASQRFEGNALHEMVFPHPVFSDEAREAQQSALTATEWAQPAIGAASLALLGVLRALGVKPGAVAGHSYGEVTALHAAGVLDETAFVGVSRRRGELMRDAAATTAGAMTAVVAKAEELRPLMAQWGLDVVLANHNGPKQAVLSGPTPAIAAAEEKLTAAKIGFKRLGVATAFHSSVVAASCVPFGEHLASVAFGTPVVPVYGNASAAPYPADAKAMRETLGGQIAQPVRFVEEVEAMYAAGVRTFVEVGPSAVLTDLVGRILKGKAHLAVALDRKGKHGVSALQESLGRLAVAGVAMDFAALDGEVIAAPRAKKKPAMTLSLNGSNYAKPYPPKEGAAALPKPNPERKPEVVRVVERVEVPVEVRVPAAAGAAPAVGDDVQHAWVRAYQDMQRQTADAHAAYQRATADSHAAFLRAAETSMSTLATMLTGQAPVAVPSIPSRVLQTPPPSVPSRETSPPSPLSLSGEGGPDQNARATIGRSASGSPSPDRERGLGGEVSRETGPMAAAPAVDLEKLMMEIVAEKTGYPVSMLGLSMELEADLGVDSIKRVEILSTMRERAPGLGEVNPNELAKLRTLGQIVDHMRGRLGSAAAPVAAAAPKAAAVDLEKLMMEIVAEKTGYPVAMLGLQMELEADLGIDSIKRVEILSTMRERAPGLGEVNPNELAKLRTLGQIVDHMRGTLGAAAPALAAPAAAPAIDLEKLMMEIVAEKTGYPVSMLGLSMELEADLGIDSIKRVEILSTMRERAPGLGEVNPNELAKLRTLGQIVDHMRGTRGGPAAAATTAAPAATAKPIRRLAVRARPVVRPGVAVAGLLGARRLVVTSDGGALAGLVVARLAAAGAAAELVAEVPADADAAVLLGGMRAVTTRDEALAVHREAFRGARALATRFTASGGLFVTVQDTGGDFGLSGRSPLRAWTAGVAALARTAAREWPKAHVRALDVERGSRGDAEVAQAIVDELLLGGSCVEVGLAADGSRVTLDAVDVPVDGTPVTVDASSVVLASGGARGVTAASLEALAKATKASMVLLGRTPLADETAASAGARDEAALKRALLEDAAARGAKVTPAEVGAKAQAILATREVRATIAAMEGAGSKVRYLAVDVQDAKGLAKALDGVRAELGPVTALVHGAGVLADKLLAEKTDAQFDRVFDTKVLGLAALLDATAGDPLRSIELFSSVAARAGNPGQSDYAMANEVLNAVACAERARRPGCAVSSVGWGPWEGGMVTPSLKAHFERAGVTLVPLATGARIFVDELTHRATDGVVVVGATAGDEALGVSGERVGETEVLVSAKTHPEVGDHRIAGAPVLPVALAVEFLVRGAADFTGGGRPLAVRDVKVLRGVRLEHYDGRGDRLVVRARVAGDVIAVELRGPNDALHYSALVDARDDATPLATGRNPAGLTPWVARAEIYDGHVLFHGPRFQVIRGVDGVSDDGLVARVEGLVARGWTALDFRTDPAVTDGALQAAVLWAEGPLGGAALPMSVGAMRLAGPGPASSELRATVRARSVSGARATCDVVLTGADGATFAVLEEVALVQRPGEPGRSVAPAAV